VFMSLAYSWAFTSPIKKLYYNLSVTGLSVFVALVIGVVEVLQVVSRFTNWTSGLWSVIDNFDLGSVGYFIVGVFVVTWICALLYFRFRHVEERWSGSLER
jgi:nickel/cobalt transporter (NiCoT) family protein